MVAHGNCVLFFHPNSPSRGLIDGSTTLELDNGITKVPRTFCSVVFLLILSRTVWSWSGMMKKYFHQNVRTQVLQFVLHLAAAFEIPHPLHPSFQTTPHIHTSENS